MTLFILKKKYEWPPNNLNWDWVFQTAIFLMNCVDLNSVYFFKLIVAANNNIYYILKSKLDITIDVSVGGWGEFCDFVDSCWTGSSSSSILWTAPSCSWFERTEKTTPPLFFCTRLCHRRSGYCYLLVMNMWAFDRKSSSVNEPLEYISCWYRVLDHSVSNST